MALEFRTNIITENPKVLQAFAREFGQHAEIDQKNQKVFIENFGWVPTIEAVNEISKRYPNDLLDCETISDDIYFREICKFRYLGGKQEFISLRPNYRIVGPIPHFGEMEADAIVDQAIAICKRLDPVIDEKKESRIDWLDGTIIFSFDHKSKDGQVFRIETEKTFNLLKFRIFRQVSLGYRYQEIPYDSDNDIPF